MDSVVKQSAKVVSVELTDPRVMDRKGFEKKVKANMNHAKEAVSRGLLPTIYFFEALDYVRKAKKLQDASLQRKKVPNVGDPLMEAIPIYNTVQRRYAGFSNVLEQLWYGPTAPKVLDNIKRDALSETVFFIANRKQPWHVRAKKFPVEWLMICLAHRITGSGASFEWDHGFRNNRIIQAAELTTHKQMGEFLADYDSPIFTSIGNQIPPFPKVGGRVYLKSIALEMAERMHSELVAKRKESKKPMGIKEAVDMALYLHTQLGCKQFKFVLTAWVMDIAEYMPKLVDPNSDCYHGKNAIESIEICFEINMKKQDLYDTATRLFSDVCGPTPYDMEDVFCDFIRWIESYVPRKGFEHVLKEDIYNGNSLAWNKGRQPPPF